MAFDRCPECGETNHSEDDDGERHFECGFSGYEDRRTELCSRKSSMPARSDAAGPDDSAARYRLALLDAAHVIDGIAGDAQGAGGDLVARLGELTQQMRAFAGHDEPRASFGHIKETEKNPPAGGLIAFIKRATRGKAQA